MVNARYYLFGPNSLTNYKDKLRGLKGKIRHLEQTQTMQAKTQS
jgi:hypothetical protein